jgi:hypothetical protein
MWIWRYGRTCRGAASIENRSGGLLREVCIAPPCTPRSPASCYATLCLARLLPSMPRYASLAFFLLCHACQVRRAAGHSGRFAAPADSEVPSGCEALELGQSLGAGCSLAGAAGAPRLDGFPGLTWSGGCSRRIGVLRSRDSDATSLSSDDSDATSLSSDDSDATSLDG